MERKIKKRKVMDIAAPVKVKKVKAPEKPEFPLNSEKAADFLMEKSVDSRFIIGSSPEELKKLNEKINDEMEEIEEKITEFEKAQEREFKKDEKEFRHQGRNKKSLFISVGLLALIALIVFVAGFILPKAEVRLALKTEEWKYEGSVLASAAISVASAEKKEITAEIFPLSRNFSFSYPATGRNETSRQAVGKITIFNEFSSANQTLVSTTRFVAPDGKIFRLKNNVVVPGTKTENGKLVPGQVEAEVYADKAGEEYNIGPVEKFTIPGFSGTPKYEKFYASSKAAMTGGFVGEAAYATDTDVEAAKVKARAEMRERINAFVNTEIPKDFKVLDEAKEFSVLKELVDRETDTNGNFSVFLDAQISVIAFKEADLLKIFADLAEPELKQGKIKRSYSLNYSAAKADTKKKEISFQVSYVSVYVPEFDPGYVKTDILGKKEKDLRSFIYTLPEIDHAQISFWPMWVSRVPKNPEKVTIVVE